MVRWFQLWAAPRLATFRDVAGGALLRVAYPFWMKGWEIPRFAFELFSTGHSNGTNKVIDTRGIFCYSFPCLPSSTLADLLIASSA
jgi:hypothetical protein